MSDTKPESSVPTTLPAPAANLAHRAGRGLLWFIALVVLAGASYGVWREVVLESGRASAANADAQRLGAQVEVLTHTVEQLRGNTDTLRARLEDGAKVGKSEREELLGLSERARLLEDAVANLADKRLSGHDALLLNEAELLLTLGGERYALFHDAGATIVAYRLADTTLSEVEDAAFSTVRQSVDAEIVAVNALQAADPSPLVQRLAQVRAQVPHLPVAARMQAAAPVAPVSRLWQVLGALVQVHHGEDAQASLALRDARLARTLAALDLREAEAALLARDDVGYRVALAEARTQLTAFDPAAPAVVAAQAELGALDKALLAPPLPSILGAALKELRNLRATHALHAPPPAPPPIPQQSSQMKSS